MSTEPNLRIQPAATDAGHGASASEPTPSQPEAQGTPRQALINRLARALDDKLAAQDNAQYWLDRARQLETELAAECAARQKAETERDEYGHAVDAKCSLLANIGDTLRSRYFDGSIGQMDERVIAMAKVLDATISERDALQAKLTTSEYARSENYERMCEMRTIRDSALSKVSELQAKLAEVRRVSTVALTRAFGVFDRYAILHSEKNPPAEDKAMANVHEALACQEAIAQLAAIEAAKAVANPKPL